LAVIAEVGLQLPQLKAWTIGFPLKAGQGDAPPVVASNDTITVLLDLHHSAQPF